MLNKFKKNKDDMQRLSDKLLNIVNNFHNNSGIYNLKKNRKSIKGIKTKIKKNSDKNFNTISFNKIK